MSNSTSEFRRASRFFLDHKTRLAAQLGEYLFRTHPALQTRHGTYGLEKARERLELYFCALANTIALDTPVVFAEDLRWFKTEFEHRGLAPLDFESVVREAFQFLQEAVPTAQAQAVENFLRRTLETWQKSQGRKSVIARANPLQEIADRILDLLLVEERAVASALLFSAANAGISVEDIYTSILQPVQYEVGQLWEAGRITVSQEHYCTASILSFMSELYPTFVPVDEAGERRPIVVAALGEEAHGMGVRMLADFLEMDQWDVLQLRGDVDPERIEEALCQSGASLLALSSTMSFTLLAMEEIIGRIHRVFGAESSQRVDVIVGGRPFVLDKSLGDKVGADYTAHDASTAVRAIRALSRGKEPTQSLNEEGPVGTIWWWRAKEAHPRLVRDDLGLTATDEDLGSWIAETETRGSPREFSPENDLSDDDILCVDVVRRGETALIAAAQDTSHLSALMDEAITTFEKVEKVLHDPSLDKYDSPLSSTLSRRGISGLYAEMTELQRELALKKLTLESMQRDRNALLAMVAHDLRNALTIIDANSFLLRELLGNFDVPKEVLDHLQAISDKSQLVLELTNDLQELARLETTSVNRDPVALEPLIDEDVKNAQTMGKEKKISVELEIDDPLPVISADATLIRRLLDNLLNNALKFSPPRSTVRVRAGTDDGQVRMEIRDQGPGIPDDELGHLFELFFRGSARPTGGEKSTGLGLPIIKRIVDAHGGTIEVDSTVGQGTAFTVWLPVDSPR